VLYEKILAHHEEHPSTALRTRLWTRRVRTINSPTFVFFVSFVVKYPYRLGALCVLCARYSETTGARSAPYEILFFLTFATLRLCGRYSETDRCAKRTYENLRVLRAFVVKIS